MAVREEQAVNFPLFDKKVPISDLIGTHSAVSEKTLKEILEHRHKEYKRYQNSWRRSLDCYTGDIEKMREYLSRHLREHQKNYQNRRARASYINYCEPVVDLYISYIYRRPIVRKPLGDLSLPASISMLRQIQLQQEHHERRALQSSFPQQPQQFGGPPQQQQPPPGGGEEEGEEAAEPQVLPPQSPAEASAIEEREDISAELARISLMAFIQSGGPQQLAIFNELYKDADLRGTTLDRYMQERGTDSQICGHVGILVDAPTSNGDQPINEEERRSRRIRPYLATYTADDIVDWVLDGKGKFEWVRLKEEIEEPRGPFEGEPEKATVYYTWTKDSWHKHKVTSKGHVEFLEEGPNQLGEVPLVLLYNKRKKDCELVGDSAIDDISTLNISIFNWLSMLDEEVYQKCCVGSTLIDCPRDLKKYPNGIPIKDLVDREFDTYSWDERSGRFVIRKAHSVRKTGINKPVVKVTFEYLDEYENIVQDHIKVTPDHLVLLQSGEWVEAKDLQEGDQLVPLVRWVDAPHKGYSWILPDGTMESKFPEHRFVYSQTRGALIPKHHVHHIDDNRLNNYPVNLDQLTKSEHHTITTNKVWDTMTEEKFANRSAKLSRLQKKVWSRKTEEERLNHKVVSVRDAGYEDVYNMEVEGTENYVANGVVIHNCLAVLTLKTGLENQQGVTLSSDNVLEYPDERPGFIAPPTEPWDFIIKLIQTSVEEIYRIARMGGGGTGLRIREAQSGIAHAYEFSETNQALSDKADSLEQAEVEIHRLYARWYDREWSGKVAYPDEFGVDDLSQELQFLIQSRSSFTSITAKRELEKRVAKKLLQSNVDEKTIRRIMAEIDSNSPEDYKAPGEFFIPGVTSSEAVPGAEAMPIPFGSEDADLLEVPDESSENPKGKKKQGTIPKDVVRRIPPRRA